MIDEVEVHVHMMPRNARYVLHQETLIAFSGEKPNTALDAQLCVKIVDQRSITVGRHGICQQGRVGRILPSAAISLM